MPIEINEVDYSKYMGGGDIDSWIADACRAVGFEITDGWVDGYKTLCQRESSYLPNAINTTDVNAHGAVVGDGHPVNCSRGLAQCIPSTFAAYHVDGTSKSIYDPVANIEASMKYVCSKYHVKSDGSDFAEKVQQADPARPPKGYDIDLR